MEAFHYYHVRARDFATIQVAKPIRGHEKEAWGRHASRPLRMKESRSINGAERPLHWHCLRSLPAHPRVRSSWAPSSPAAARMWGHSSRCFAFGGVCGDTPLVALPSEGCPHYYPWAARFRLHPHLTRSFFPRREKRSLIPPCAPSIRRRVYQPTDPATAGA